MKRMRIMRYWRVSNIPHNMVQSGWTGGYSLNGSFGRNASGCISHIQNYQITVPSERDRVDISRSWPSSARLDTANTQVNALKYSATNPSASSGPPKKNLTLLHPTQTLKPVKTHTSFPLIADYFNSVVHCQILRLPLLPSLHYRKPRHHPLLRLSLMRARTTLYLIYPGWTLIVSTLLSTKKLGKHSKEAMRRIMMFST